MTYKELFAVADLLKDIRKGVIQVNINNDTNKVDLASAENYFKNIIADVRKKRVIGQLLEDEKDLVIYYRLAIEVNK